MRTRYMFDAVSGLLVDRNGEPLGRVVSITLDTTPLATTERVGDGVAVSLEGATALPSEALRNTNLVPHTPQREAIARVWDYWIEISGKRQRLDSKRERIIRNALKLVGEEQVKQALLGLSRSPWHGGENPEHKKYLEIRHALKGHGDESDDERIEKAIAWAAIYSPARRVTLSEAKVQRLLDEIRYTLSFDHKPEVNRAKVAWRTLTEAGFKVVKLDRPPYARVEQ